MLAYIQSPGKTRLSHVTMQAGYLSLHLGEAQFLGFVDLLAATGNAQGQGVVLGVGGGDGSSRIRADETQHLLELRAGHVRGVLVLLLFKGDAADLNARSRCMVSSASGPVTNS